MIRIGIAGTGGMAQQRASTLLQRTDVKVTAVASRSAEKARTLAEPWGARVVSDFGALLDGADAVILCLPNHLHAPRALEALARGKHVLVEYPLCIRPEEAQKLEAAAAASDRVLMVGNTIVHEAMFRYVKDRCAPLGALMSASSRVAFFGADVAGAWYMDPQQAGSTFTSYHYHHIEYARRLLGEVAWVAARDESRPDPARPGFLSVSGGTLVLGHASGAAWSVQWYLSAHGAGDTPRGFWLNGERGSLTIVSHERDRSLAVWDVCGERATEVFADDWGVTGSNEDFVQAIRGALDPRARLASDLATLRVGFAAVASAQRRVALPLDAAASPP